MLNAIFLYKIQRKLYLMKIPIIPKIIKLIIFLIYNSSIPYEAQIGEGTSFGYGGMGVVIHKRSVIGKRCSISQQVTIGGRSGSKEVPIIGDDVYIGAGAKVLGAITIGDKVVIGANAVVIQSVPKNAIVAGVPAKIIKYL